MTHRGPFQPLPFCDSVNNFLAFAVPAFLFSQVLCFHLYFSSTFFFFFSRMFQKHLIIISQSYVDVLFETGFVRSIMLLQC